MEKERRRTGVGVGVGVGVGEAIQASWTAAALPQPAAAL
jgi:hypothetical protein